MKSIFTLLILFICFKQLSAIEINNTTDSSKRIIKIDSAKTKNDEFKPNPKKAAIYSALCPGLGQIYNRKYWKLPVVYAAFGTCAYFIYINANGYNNTKKGIERWQDGDKSNDNTPIVVTDYTLKKYNLSEQGATVSDLLAVKKSFRTNLDISVITAFAFYILNIVDANVDAHLYGFNISDDLTISPLINQNGVGVAFMLR